MRRRTDGSSDSENSSPTGNLRRSRSSYPTWRSDETYHGGDRVTHDWSVWEAQWWTRG
ncbi:hypothetical protein EA472_06150 [Natrarchaeobius oligotrophus]|uniref:Chitin-binding type-3 domain-containing protein n=1 Tax=Natrarchaeobius chitinivorans TaxID=1679083 RepID=A0A3N6PRG2_NATCH|nr:hypothetical protein EA472_06150 [Natrarchaeobius chitinivorans]